MKNKIRWSWLLVLKGAAMGIADVIPGISGGTIALLLGIYEQFIESLSALTPQSFINIFKGELDPALVFLTNLGLGIAGAILLGAKLIHYCLEYFPELVWGVFLALVVSSLVILIKREKLSLASFFLFLIGAVLAYFVNQLIPETTAISSLSIFIGGFVAIFAMMLPGVSGSFLLLVLGLYQHIILCLKNPLEIESLKTLSIFAIGASTGLILGSRLLKALLKRYHHETLMVLLGFMLGSTPKLWPWQSSSFSVDAYNISVVIIMVMSTGIFYYLSRITDLKEIKSRNKIDS